MPKAQLPREIHYNISPQMFNEVYYPYLERIFRYEVYFGGSGSGKSNFVAHKLALQLTVIAGRNLVCLRKQGVDVKDSCYPEIYAAMEEFKLLDLWDIVEHPMPRMTNRINGNVIAFSGLDKIENIKSIRFKKGRLTDVWYEEATEEPDPANIRELDRRLRDPKHKCRIIVTFNPVLVTHWIKNWIEVELKGTDCLVLRTTYRDNRFIDEEYKQVLERYRLTDPYSYMVYALGQWGTMGQTVFNANQISQRLVQLKERFDAYPPKRAEFAFSKADNGQIDRDSFKIFYHADGETTIYQDPIPGHPYVLAFDTAGEGSDFYAAHVCDNMTDEEVAVFHSPRLPHDCLPQIYGLARHYNFALVCPEVNFDRYPIEKLKELEYPNLYVREFSPDRLDKQVDAKIGFRTTSENRQQILSDLVDWTAEHIDKINDIQTLHEMLSFTRQAKKMKGIFWAAEPGAHDDLVMSLAILLQAKEQQITYAVEPKKKLEGFYMPEELEFLVDSGRISREDMDEYTEKAKADLGMWAHEEPSRRSRYAR